MSGPHPAVAAVRTAVRDHLRAVAADYGEPSALTVALSGGADSLALTEATAHVARRRGLPVTALVVDHGLQDGSAGVAARAAETAERLGVDQAKVLTVDVGIDGGPEAAARRARYAALRTGVQPGGLVLLGHTRDDQAETVLLGLGRGSGPRSMSGMAPWDPPWGRPLLGVERTTTVAACDALGLTPWQDPHNADPRFTRVRLRNEVLPLLDEVLAGGVSAALARTAAQLREDSAALDDVAATVRDQAQDGPALRADALRTVPPAIRRRVLRRWLLDTGAAELTDAHLRSVDALIGSWRGQGGVWLPGDLVVNRAHGRLCLQPYDRSKGD